MTADRAALLADYLRAKAYVDVELVRLTPRRKDPAGKVRTALAFNAALGDPQRAYPSLQVAGTSGKGTVSTLLAVALQEAGLTTGLHVSPYLQVLSEKTWIAGQLLDAAGLARAVEELRPVAERFRADEEGPASVHGLAALGLSYLAFREAGLDLAVVETGCGGRFDLVQGLRRELSVITDLGLDHQQALGETVEQIAWHKAGVIEAGRPCVAIRGPGWEVLAEEARAVGAELTGVDPAPVMAGRRLTEGGQRLAWTLPRLGPLELELPQPAPWLARNAVLAATALDRLAGLGWPLRAEHLARAWARPLQLPGRSERVQDDPPVVLDGAHNPQKLAAALAGLDGPQVVLLALTGERDPGPLLRLLAGRTRALVTCAPTLYGKEVQDPGRLAAAARAAGIAAEAADSPAQGLERALELARAAGAGVLVTGSLYLIGEVRDRWHPWEEVLLQRTSWPRPAVRPAPLPA